MTESNIKPIRLYTYSPKRDLNLSGKKFQQQIDGKLCYYVIEPDDLKSFNSKYEILGNEKLDFDEDKILNYIIRNTTVETAIHYSNITDDPAYTGQLPYYFNAAINSLDHRMWKYIIDNGTDISDIHYLYSIVVGCNNDEFIDRFIVVCNYINITEKIIKLAYSNLNGICDLLISCVDNSNYKILKYVLDICGNELANQLKSVVIYTIEHVKEDFVDLLLGYCKPILDTGHLIILDDVSCKSVRYLHQLWIDDRIVLDDDFVINTVYMYHKNYPDVATYLITAFPHNQYNHIINIHLKSLLDDICDENKQLIAQLETN